MEIFNEQEHRLRELNGVLDLAVLLAVDVIVEHDAHGLSKHEWQRRLLSQSARRLADAGQFAGRLTLFDDSEILALFAMTEHARDRSARSGLLAWASLEQEEVATGLRGEVEFEIARRGIPRWPGETGEGSSDVVSTVVPDAGRVDERGGR